MEVDESKPLDMTVISLFKHIVVTNIHCSVLQNFITT